MPAASRNALTEFIFRIHPGVYRRTGGLPRRPSRARPGRWDD